MKNRIIVEKLLRHTNKILEYTKEMSYSQFSTDDMLIEACVFNLSQMGELANKIDDDFAASHNNLPWRYLYGLRNRIVHDYDGVNLQLIWEIISGDLPDLKTELERLL